jgi:hypothetical protein
MSPQKWKGIFGSTVAFAIAYTIVNAVVLGAAAHYTSVIVLGAIIGAIIGLSCATIFAARNKFWGGIVTAAVIWGVPLTMMIVTGKEISYNVLFASIVMLGLGLVSGTGYKLLARE